MTDTIVINEDRSSGSVEPVNLSAAPIWNGLPICEPCQHGYCDECTLGGCECDDTYGQHGNTLEVSTSFHREAGLHESRGAGVQLALGSDTSYTTVQQ